MAWHFKQQMYIVSIITKKGFKKNLSSFILFPFIHSTHNEIALFLKNPSLPKCRPNGAGGKQNNNILFSTRYIAVLGFPYSLLPLAHLGRGRIDTGPVRLSYPVYLSFNHGNFYPGDLVAGAVAGYLVPFSFDP